MISGQFDSIQFYMKKKNILLYKAVRGSQQYVLKCTLPSDQAAGQAFYDEYSVMSRIRHPHLPAYHGLFEDYRLPDQDGRYLALCMQDLSRGQIIDPGVLSMAEILSVMRQTGLILSDLLKYGILYTDLNPSNLILTRRGGLPFVYLLDFTCCYFFLKNPHPAYRLRFSYDLSPDFKGQQMLIQELSFLLQDLLEAAGQEKIPGKVYQLMETGMHPPEGLALSTYNDMIAETCRPHDIYSSIIS